MRAQSGVTRIEKGHADFDLARGTGIRTHTQRVSFPEAFDERPTVGIGLAHLDVPESGGEAVAVDVDLVAVDTAGFEVEYSTWGDNRVDGVGIQWIAVAD